ncbi:MAG: hypothetical protein ACHQAY_19515 [Hyphomicrobiales bacterium]
MANDETAELVLDPTMPAGTFRFAEFFRVEKDKVLEIKLVFDASAFRKLIAR